MSNSIFSLASRIGRSLLLCSPVVASHRVELHRDDLWKIGRRSSPASIRCERGAIWVTREGDLKDIVLTAGHRCDLAPGGLAVISALSEAEFCVGTR